MRAFGSWLRRHPNAGRRIGQVLLLGLFLGATGQPVLGSDRSIGSSAAVRSRATIAVLEPLQVQPQTLSGGVTSTVYLVFPLTAPAGDTVWLSTDQPSLVNVPAKITPITSPTNVAVR